MNGENCDNYQKKIMPLGVVPRGSTDRFAIADPILAKTLRFVRDFATTGIRVTDVLREVDLSNRTLERYFKETLGHTPEREIFLTKIRHAVWLLTSTPYPNREIAKLAGFSNEQYFCKAFKREKGQTPTEYRREHRSETLPKDEERFH